MDISFLFFQTFTILCHTLIHTSGTTKSVNCLMLLYRNVCRKKAIFVLASHETGHICIHISLQLRSSKKPPKNSVDDNYLRMWLWRNSNPVLSQEAASLLIITAVIFSSLPGNWERKMGRGGVKKQQGLVLPRSVIKKIKSSLDCCDSLVNFQGTAIFHSDNFCQSFHCFCGRRNFQSSICHHSRRASLVCDLRSSLLNFIVSATSNQCITKST